MTTTQHNTSAMIGYARCSTARQDLTAQREFLQGLGVASDRIYLDHGLTGTNRARPGLDQALAAVRAGDTLVVPKLDRLARSVPDARAIGDALVARGVKLQLGGQRYDPTDPLGKLFFNILATFAEFEADLARLRTREGMAIARAKGKLKGKPPKLSARQQAHGPWGTSERKVTLTLRGLGLEVDQLTAAGYRRRANRLIASSTRMVISWVPVATAENPTNPSLTWASSVSLTEC